MDSFNIQLNNHETGVTRRDEDVFIVRLPEKTIYLEKRQDNEGANHWFEQGKDNETTLTANIGAAIETWLAKNNS